MSNRIKWGENMSLVKKIKIGKSEIEIYSDVTKEENKKNLENIYNTIRKIATNKVEQGIDVSNWFYTQEEIEAMKKSGKYNFL